MVSNTLVTPSDYVFYGFLFDKFPLGSVERTMCILHQRTIAKDIISESDIRGRVYYNLVVFFRLLWHHQTLEPSPAFWKYVLQDIPIPAKPHDLEALMAFYVSARAAFRRRYQDNKGPGSFLARLVDQWRSRPLISKDMDPRSSPPLFADLHFKLRASWDGVRLRGYADLAQSKELNWPTFAVVLQDKPKPKTKTKSNGNSSSHQSEAGKGASKQLSKTTKVSTAADWKQEGRLSLPPAPWGKKDGASSISISLPTGKFNSEPGSLEPGRLTPPVVELQSLCQKKAPSVAGPPPVGRKNASNSVTEGESSMPATPPKRPAPHSDELSPYSKRRCVTKTEPMLATSSENAAHLPGETSPFSKRRCMTQMTKGQSGNTGAWGSAFVQAPTSVQRNGGAEAPSLDASNVPKQSIEEQSLEEMIAAAVGSPPPGNGSSNVLPSFPANAGEFTLPGRDAPAGAAPSGVGPPPIVTTRGSSLVVIDMPATIFAFSRKIESLKEKMDKGQAGGRGFITALSRDVGTLSKTVRAQAEVHNVASTLSRKVTDLEKMVQGRADVSATVASSVSALTWTMGCLEKKLGEATATQNTMADLNHRMAELENITGGGYFTESGKVTGLQTTVDSQPKLLEEGEIEKAGEFVEYRENRPEHGSSSP